jgi:hypothetical protein
MPLELLLLLLLVVEWRRRRRLPLGLEGALGRGR